MKSSKFQKNVVRARATPEEKSVVLKSASIRVQLNELTFVENCDTLVTHSVLGAVCNDGIRREFYLCLLWRRIHATNDVLHYLRQMTFEE